MDRYYGNRFVQLLKKLKVYQSAKILFSRLSDVYGHLASLRRGLLNPHVITVLYSDFRAHKWPSEHQREGMGTIEYWHRMSCKIKCWSREECKFYFPAAVFCSGSHLSGPCPSSPLLQASITKQIMAPLGPALLLLLWWARCRSGSIL